MKRIEHVGAQLSQHIIEIHALLSEIDGRFVEIERREHEGPEAGSNINQVLPELITRRHDLVRGAGVAYGTSKHGSKNLWMDWWDRGAASTLSFKEHNFSRTSLRFYDYRSSDWYVGAIENASLYAAGPYLDTGGTEAMVITVSLPSRSERSNDTVIAADICPDSLERKLLAFTSAEDKTMVLLNDQHEIVASTGRDLDYGRKVLPSENDVYLSAPGVFGAWSLKVIDPQVSPS